MKNKQIEEISDRDSKAQPLRKISRQQPRKIENLNWGFFCSAEAQIT